VGGEPYDPNLEPVPPKPTLNQQKWKLMIKVALLRKNRAGKGDFLRPKPKDSKRQKTREFWKEHPDVQPWNLKNGKMSKHYFLKGGRNE
jgi:hypothetical protein